VRRRGLGKSAKFDGSWLNSATFGKVLRLTGRDILANLLKALGGIVAVVAVMAAWLWWSHFRMPGTVSSLAIESSDGTLLHGEFYLPHGPSPHPGVVLLAGSGPELAASLDHRGLANAFLKKGFGVLVYDKRGAGRSGGDFDTATYADFVEDGLAAVKALRGRDAIRDDQIGIFGISEGGWFTPEIAFRDGSVRFIINSMASPLSAGETYLWEIRHELIEGGFDDERAIDKILSLRVRIWDYYRDALQAQNPFPDRRATLEAELSDLSGPWLEIFPMRIGDYNLEKYRRWCTDIFYDPMPFLLEMDQPLFATYAGADQNTPTEQSLEVLKMLSEEHEKTIFTRVYPGRRHSLMKWYDIPLSFGYPPDYFSGMSEWAEKQVETE
jgi:uncharacterized protein